MRRVVIVLFAALFALAMAPAHADIIFDNGAPSLTPSPYADIDFYQEVVDDFQLVQGAATITDIHWWGYYTGSATLQPDDFYIRIFADTGSGPAITPFYQANVGNVARVDTGDDVVGVGALFDLYAYSVVVSPIALTPDTTYWIAILNDTSNDLDDQWAWAESSEDVGNRRWRPADGNSWNTSPGEQAFYLTNDPVVPEPATVAMFGIGLSALFARKCRGKS